MRRIGGWPRSIAERAWQARRSWALTTLAGTLVFLSFPKWNAFPLAFFAMVPLMFVCHQGGAARAFRWGAWAGLVTNLGGFYWIVGMLQDFGFLPLVVAVPLYIALCAQQGLSWALAAALAVALRARGAGTLLAWVAGVAVAESVVPMIFPWYFGNSQALNITFIQVAELGGVVAVTCGVVAANVVVYDVVSWLRRRKAQARPRTRTWVAALAVASVFGYGAIRVPQIDAAAASAPKLRVGLVQANIGIFAKSESESLEGNLLIHQRISAELAAEGVELLVWPETAFQPPTYAFALTESADLDVARADVRLSRRFDRDATWLPRSTAPLVDDPSEDAALATRAPDALVPQRGFDVPLLTGVVMWSERTAAEVAAAPPRGGRPWPLRAHNAAVLLDRDGRVLGSYDKSLLMPFSEHVPLGYWVYRALGVNLYDIIPSAGDFYMGSPTEGVTFESRVGPVRLGLMICYEDIMPSFGRAIHRGRPDMIVNMTNDAWFGDTSEPYLHLALAVFRTVEQRTYLVRSTNTGISAFVDPVGRIVAQTPLFEEAGLIHDVAVLPATTTPFMRFGNWPPVLFTGWALVLVTLRRSARPQAGNVAQG